MAATRTFALALDNLMEDRGLLTSDVAKALGITPSAVSQWRAPDGGTLPSMARARQLEALFGLEPDELCRWVRNDRRTRGEARTVSVTATGTATSSATAEGVVTPRLRPVPPTSSRSEAPPRLRPVRPRPSRPFVLGESPLGGRLGGVEDLDPDDLVFAYSARAKERLATMTAKMDQVKRLHEESAELLARVDNLSLNAPGRSEEIRDLQMKASKKLVDAAQLLTEVEVLRKMRDGELARAEWIIKTTRHVVQADGKSDDEVMSAKVQDVVRRRTMARLKQRRAELDRQYERAEESVSAWFQTDQPDVTALLALVRNLVNRINALEDQVAHLRLRRDQASDAVE